MKPRDFPLSEEYIPETAERNLWFAVIERALKDYCFFFDQLTKVLTVTPLILSVSILNTVINSP